MMDEPIGQADRGPGGPAHLFDWPLSLGVVWLLAPLVGVAIRLGFSPIGPHDYWWSLAMGKVAALGGEIPSANLFLYTMPADAPYLDQPWLSQWLMYLVVDGVGHVGPLLLRNALATLAVACLVWAALRRCPEVRMVGAFALWVAVLGGTAFGVRTQMFVLVPFAALIWVLFEAADGRLSPPWLLALAPLTALWANLHGSFLLVPALVGLVGVSIAVERLLEGDGLEAGELAWWGGAAGACTVAAALTPHGIDIYSYVWELSVSSTVSETVTEWQPPRIGSGVGPLVMLGFLVGLVVFVLARREVRIFEVVLFAATAYLAFGAERQVFWWAAIVAMVVPRHLVGIVGSKMSREEATSRLQGLVHAALVVSLSGCAVLAQPGLLLHQVGAASLDEVFYRGSDVEGLFAPQNSIELVERLGRLGYPGNIFHDQAVGGLLEYELGTEPVEQVAFVDQRMELIPERIWTEYFTISRAEEGWEEIVDGYDIETMLLSPKEQARLVERLEESDRWSRVGRDQAHVLFMRNDREEHITRWRSEPSETGGVSR